MLRDGPRPDRSHHGAGPVGVLRGVRAPGAVRQVRRSGGVRGRFAGHHDARPGLQQAAEQAIATELPHPKNDPRPPSSRWTLRPARSSRWRAAATGTRTNSTTPRCAGGPDESPDRRSRRSRSRPRCSRVQPQRLLARALDDRDPRLPRSDAARRHLASGQRRRRRGGNVHARRRDRPLREYCLRAADRTARPGVGRGRGAQARHPVRAARRVLDHARLRGRQPARDDERVRHIADQGIATGPPHSCR